MTKPANDRTYGKPMTVTVVAWTKTGKRTRPNSRSARAWGLAVWKDSREWISVWRTSSGLCVAASHAAKVLRLAGEPSRWDSDVWGTSYRAA